MSFQIGDPVETSRDARWMWRKVRIKTPGVVTAVRTDRSGVVRYTVAFGVQDAPDSAVVIRGLRESALLPAGGPPAA